MNGCQDERPRWLLVVGCYGDGGHGGSTVGCHDSGWFKWMVETSLPIVLKPKPATVRLEVVDRGGRLLKWIVMVDSHGG
jgi:polygalacturonase